MAQSFNRREFLGALGAGLVSPLLAGCGSASGRPPNFVVIFCDDAGYADIGTFGAKGYVTPHLDRMAAEGMRFTDFHAATAVCSASRAALLTGCYPERVGILGALNHESEHGIGDSEMTIAGVLKQKGYSTAIYGKWHLGHHPRFLPTRHGFDEYFGLPYSNDMWPYHPTAGDRFPPLPLIEGERIIEYNPDQSNLTTWYTERAVGFIERNRERPFFLYVPHSMPHVPLFVSEKFRGKSELGLYGDVMMEIDWSVGQILDALKRNGLDENTIVIFTSDNGPWLSYGDHAGSAGPLREGKGTMFEGGTRAPTVMRWPGRIPAGAECDELATTMDILPTLSAISGAALPPHRIDGHDISPLVFGRPGAGSPDRVFYCYWNGELQAVRSGSWKLHFPHSFRTLDGRPGGTGGFPVEYEQGEIEKSLFDLQDDIEESRNVYAEHPDIVARLEALAEIARDDLGDKLTGRVGSGCREPGRI